MKLVREKIAQIIKKEGIGISPEQLEELRKKKLEKKEDLITGPLLVYSGEIRLGAYERGNN